MGVEFFLFLSQARLSIGELVARAQAAEVAGFDGIAGGDHLVPPLATDQSMYEALTVNAWLAARTDRLVQSQLVLCDAFRHPAVLARQAVTIDHASGGRFQLGIGAGSVIEEFTTFGIEPKTPGARVRRLSETLEILAACWSGDTFDYDGEFFRLEGARQQPVPLTKIPLVIGGVGPRMLQLVAKHADWWNCMVTNLSRLDELRNQVGDARVSTQHMIAFVANEAERERIAERAHVLFPFSGLVVGSKSQLIDLFADLHEHGVERFYVAFTDLATPDTIAGFGREVISAFAA